MNLPTIIIGLVVLAALRPWWYTWCGAQKGGCGCGCSGCPSAGCATPTSTEGPRGAFPRELREKRGSGRSGPAPHFLKKEKNAPEPLDGDPGKDI